MSKSCANCGDPVRLTVNSDPGRIKAEWCPACWKTASTVRVEAWKEQKEINIARNTAKTDSETYKWLKENERPVKRG